MTKIIKTESPEGTEFYTIEETGESGMSQSGLARLCGVRQSAICNLLKRIISSSCPEFLKPLKDKDLKLITSPYEKSSDTQIIRDEVCGIILEWYAFESQRTSKIARKSFRQFAKNGIREWIQKITGWQKPELYHTGSDRLETYREGNIERTPLQEKMLRLEIIKDGISILEKFGEIDERTQLQLKDSIKNIILEEELYQPSKATTQAAKHENKRLEYPISDRVVDLGYGQQPIKILKAIGQIASNLYLKRHGKRPPQREQYIDGTTRMVRLYPPEDLDILDAAIAKKLGEKQSNLQLSLSET